MKESKNIKLCAFLRFKGIHPTDIKKISHGKAVYCYNISDEKWYELKIEFDKSDYLTYANCIDAIKDLAY